MHLKRLEVYGFKSFANRTTVDFGEGITAIVGPNGCGKSNIVDAIRWILGEQSAKSLRGKEMSDVIFSGNDNRSALSYAAASLLVSNEDKALPIDYKNVDITRKIHRSGDGEYYINKKQSRLKSIKELFMDTGVGKKTFSVIEQGNISQFLQSDSKERRYIFEDAAGISKFRVRKEETIRRLERAQEKLIRLNDIIQEVDKQLRSATYQAQKARRYQKMSGELKKFKLSRAVIQSRKFNQRIDKINTVLDGFENQLTEIQARHEQFQAKKSEISAEYADIEQKVRKIENELGRYRSEAGKIESDIKWSSRRIDELKDHNQRLLGVISEDKESAASTCEEIQQKKRDMETISAEIEKHDQLIAEKQKALDSLSERYSTIIHDVEEKKKRIIEYLNYRSDIDNETAKISTELKMLQRRRHELEQINAKSGPYIEELEQDISDIETKIQTVNTEIQQQQDRHEEKSRKEKEQEATLADLREKLNACQQEAVRIESRLSILEGLEERYEGVAGGVKGVLEAMRKGNPNLENIHGLVADIIRMDKKYELAIETALGAKAQNIVAETADDAKKAIYFLKQQKKGRATFLPLDLIQRREPASFDTQHSGVINVASSLVQTDDRYQDLVQSLLGGTLVFADLESALSYKRTNRNARLTLVTLEGEIIYSSGAMAGGSYTQRSGLISRKNEIRRLSQERVTVNNNSIELKQKCRETETGIESISTEIVALSREINQANLNRSEMNARLSEKRHEVNHHNEILEKNKKEMEAIHQRNIQSEELLSELQTKKEELQVENQALEKQINDSQQIVQDTDTEKARLSSEINNLRIEASTTKERRNSAGTSLNHLEQTREQMEKRIQISQETRENNTTEITELEEKIKHSNTTLGTIIDNHERDKNSSMGMFQRRDEIREELERISKDEHRLAEEEKKILNEINEQKLLKREVELKLQNSSERIQEDYDIDLDSFITELENSEELQAEIQESDPDDLNGLIRETEEKIRKLGPVNVDAIDQQTQLEERSNFLHKQRDDLIESRKTLRQVIEEIEKKSRDLFITAFEEIRSNFQQTFRRLFGGGKAEIFLEKDVDVLEAGIEIVVRPPGKDLRSISLLSGGEKALTTIALLFAVFRAKPSPFCILDEVDAPLDETNIDRFMSIVKEFLDTTQFIIITHNRHTMSLSDVIYGVTMEEPGVTKVVSMKLNEAENMDNVA